MNANADPLAPYRGKLIGLAYRMLGSRADAEDVLQDAYLRFRDARAVDNPEAFLMTTVTRLCLDRLKSAKAKRETYVGPWLPEPIVDSEALTPQAATELADDLSFALLLALERLSPAERGAFLLQDVFDMPSVDVAVILGKSAAACRQLATRARKAVRAARPATTTPTESHARLFAEFLNAVGSGDVTRLAALLREDAVMLSDSGGLKPAARKPIRGGAKVARFFIGVTKKAALYTDNRSGAWSCEIRNINGALGLLVYVDGVPEQALSIAIEDEKIAAIYSIRNPEKLAGLKDPARSATQFVIIDSATDGASISH